MKIIRTAEEKRMTIRDECAGQTASWPLLSVSFML